MLEQRNPFGLVYKRRDAWKVRTKRSGFEFEQHLGWLLACQWWGCSPEQFEQYAVDKQALMIATYEAHNQIEAILADESRRKAEGRQGAGEGHGLNQRRRPSGPPMD